MGDGSVIFGLRSKNHFKLVVPPNDIWYQHTLILKEPETIELDLSPTEFLKDTDSDHEVTKNDELNFSSFH